MSIPDRSQIDPSAVANMVAGFGPLYGRRVYLNMVAGGFRNDLVALNDTTPHVERYRRLVEYTTIIKLLLSSPAPVTFEVSATKWTTWR